MYVCTRFFPNTSSFLNPVIFSEVWFHSFTSPLLSIPKIGALAVSINCLNSFAIDSDTVLSLSISEISCPTPNTPVILPLASRRVLEFNNTITRSPSFENNGNS